MTERRRTIDEILGITHEEAIRTTICMRENGQLLTPDDPLWLAMIAEVEPEMAVKKGSEAVRSAKPSEKKALKKKAEQDAAAANGDPAYESKARPIEEFPELADVLPELCLEYRRLHKVEKEAEKAKKAIGDDIGPLLEAVGCNSITDGAEWAAVRCKGSKSSISATKLVELGVDPDIIEQATVTNEYWYTQVRGVGKGGSDA